MNYPTIPSIAFFPTSIPKCILQETTGQNVKKIETLPQLSHLPKNVAHFESLSKTAEHTADQGNARQHVGRLRG